MQSEMFPRLLTVEATGPLSFTLILKAVIEVLSVVLEILTQPTEDVEKCSASDGQLSCAAIL